MLDLSAAFDTVDHSILLDRLHVAFGIGGAALGWIRTFLPARTQQVLYLGSLSSVGQLAFGVPQGSALGPFLYVLYTAALFGIIESCGLTAHSYADDTQVYLNVPASDAPLAVNHLTDCINKIEHWMGGNRLRLNFDKTQVIWMGTRQQLEKIEIDELILHSSTIQFSTKVVNLGVVFDNQLKMSEQVPSLCRSCFFQLRQIRTTRRTLTSDSTKTLVNAFVNSRLDYCNSLLYGVGEGLMDRLQRVQNAAARLVSGAKKYDHITPIMMDLHWLPIRRRVTFKVATLVYKCLHGCAPVYLADDCVAVLSIPGRRYLRSAAHLKLTVPRTRTMTSGPRAFLVCGPTVWNSLPCTLRSPELFYNCFRKNLKLTCS